MQVAAQSSKAGLSWFPGSAPILGGFNPGSTGLARAERCLLRDIADRYPVESTKAE